MKFLITAALLLSLTLRSFAITPVALRCENRGAPSLPTPLATHNDTILIGRERHKIEEIIIKPGAGIIECRVARR